MSRSFWSQEERALVLLELWARGALRLRRQQQVEAQQLLELGFALQAPRRGELLLATQHRGALEAMLDGAWPLWRAEVQALQAAGLALDQGGYQALQDRRRQASLPVLPTRINRRTASAALAQSSKAGLRRGHRQVLAQQQVALTQDGVMRLRPSAGLFLQRGQDRQDASALSVLLGGELLLPERALLDGLTLVGQAPRAVLLVENLGTYQDTPLPNGFVALHVPGWDLTAARRLPLLLRQRPLIHFGDLDPQGVEIHQRLCALLPGLRWAVPPFWGEYLAEHGLPTRWPQTLNLGDAPPLVQALAAQDRWLEQERLVLDPRLPSALEALLEPDAQHARVV